MNMEYNTWNGNIEKYTRKELWQRLTKHIKVYRKEVKNFNAMHLF